MILLFTMKYAKAIQGSSIEEHKRRGGRLASLWAALGIGVAALAFNALAVWVIYMGGHIRPSAPASGDLHPDKVGVATLDAKELRTNNLYILDRCDKLFAWDRRNS
jgi:hypothetical protein